MTAIPYDIYESQYEVIIILPLGGVKKESIELKIRDYILYITGERVHESLRDDCIPIQQECYRGIINCAIDLPMNVTYKKIHSTLSKENILTIIIPKNTLPDSIGITIEE